MFNLKKKNISYNEVDYDEPNNILGRIAGIDTCHFRGDLLHTTTSSPKQLELVAEQMTLHDLIAHLIEKDHKKRISGRSVKAHPFFYGLDTASCVLTVHPIGAIQSKDDVAISKIDNGKSRNVVALLLYSLRIFYFREWLNHGI